MEAITKNSMETTTQNSYECKGKCNGCPILITSEDGERADCSGCLPSYADCIKWYKETGKVWACHEDNTKPCVGFIAVARENNIVIKATKGLITEETTLKEIYE